MTKIPRETPPSERAALREEERKKLESGLLAEREKLKQAMAMTFGSAHGKIVLEWIRKKCRHNVPSLTMQSSPGREGDMTPSPEMTLYMAYQQALYLDLRILIPWEILKEVEYDGER